MANFGSLAVFDFVATDVLVDVNSFVIFCVSRAIDAIVNFFDMMYEVAFHGVAPVALLAAEGEHIVVGVRYVLFKVGVIGEGGPAPGTTDDKWNLLSFLLTPGKFDVSFKHFKSDKNFVAKLTH